MERKHETAALDRRQDEVAGRAQFDPNATSAIDYKLRSAVVMALHACESKVMGQPLDYHDIDDWQVVGKDANGTRWLTMRCQLIAKTNMELGPDFGYVAVNEQGYVGLSVQCDADVMVARIYGDPDTQDFVDSVLYNVQGTLYANKTQAENAVCTMLKHGDSPHMDDEVERDLKRICSQLPLELTELSLCRRESGIPETATMIVDALDKMARLDSPRLTCEQVYQGRVTGLTDADLMALADRIDYEGA